MKGLYFKMTQKEQERIKKIGDYIKREKDDDFYELPIEEQAACIRALAPLYKEFDLYHNHHKKIKISDLPKATEQYINFLKSIPRPLRHRFRGHEGHTSSPLIRKYCIREKVRMAQNLPPEVTRDLDETARTFYWTMHLPPGQSFYEWENDLLKRCMKTKPSELSHPKKISRARERKKCVA